MNIPIDIWEEVDDNMGGTTPDLTTVYVHSDGVVRYSNNRRVHNIILKKKGNRKEVARGRLQARLEIIKEHLLALDSGAVICISSMYVKKFARQCLMIRLWNLERGIRRVTV